MSKHEMSFTMSEKEAAEYIAEALGWKGKNIRLHYTSAQSDLIHGNSSEIRVTIEEPEKMVSQSSNLPQPLRTWIRPSVTDNHIT